MMIYIAFTRRYYTIDYSWLITRIYIRTPDVAAINIEIRFR